MKIISYNINGIRAAIKKGFVDWLKEASPDVICLQEIKANVDQFNVKEFEKLGYHCFWFSAELNRAEPFSVVMVSFPALIKSGSILFFVGKGPIPKSPFSDCIITEISFRI